MYHFGDHTSMSPAGLALVYKQIRNNGQVAVCLVRGQVTCDLGSLSHLLAVLRGHVLQETFIGEGLTKGLELWPGSRSKLSLTSHRIMRLWRFRTGIGWSVGMSPPVCS